MGVSEKNEERHPGVGLGDGSGKGPAKIADSVGSNDREEREREQRSCWFGGGHKSRKRGERRKGRGKVVSDWFQRRACRIHCFERCSRS